MDVIFSFFKGIGNAITTVIDFVISFFSDFIGFLKLLALLPDYILNTLRWLPSEILAMVMVIVSVVILYKVLGREG